MGKDIIVIEDFQDWNKWYADGEISVEELNITEPVYPNQGVVLKGDGCKEHGLIRDGRVVRIKHYSPCGIGAKNSEQTIALALLKDKNINLKIISGVAGSGKTLLACAHALHRMEKDNIAKIVIAKSMTPVGREIGHLKGDLFDKVAPWLGPFYDNFLNCGYSSMDLEKMMEDGTLEVTPITFIQGRSISNAIIIIDEVQNLDLSILKQIITRAAEGSEIILLGDQTQVFERFVKDRSLEVLLERGKTSPLVGSLHLQKSLRSPIADWAVKFL